MLRLSSMVLLLLCFPLLVVSERSLQTSETNSYRSAIGRWADSQCLRIDQEAVKYVIWSFDQHSNELAELHSGRKWDGTHHTVGQTLVVFYLGNMRDVKYEGGLSRGSIRCETDRMVLPVKSSSGRPTAGLTIEMADVKKYTVDQFFEEIHPLVGKDIGELQVTSNPDGATITVGPHKRGNTNKTTVEIAGEYNLVIASKDRSLRCSSTITIPAGGSVSSRCPTN